MQFVVCYSLSKMHLQNNILAILPTPSCIVNKVEKGKVKESGDLVQHGAAPQVGIMSERNVTGIYCAVTVSDVVCAGLAYLRGAYFDKLD